MEVSESRDKMLRDEIHPQSLLKSKQMSPNHKTRLYPEERTVTKDSRQTCLAYVQRKIYSVQSSQPCGSNFGEWG